MLVLIDRDKIIQFLFERAITVKELARLAGVSIQAVKNAVNGKKLQIPSVAKIARAMGITPNDLIINGGI